MVNCEQACDDMVKNYARTGFKIILFKINLFFSIGIGCGRTLKNSKTVYKYDAGGCGKGVGREVYTCA